MAEIITADFKQNLYAGPLGQKQTNPTIFDELRWAMQFSQRPLEQVMQFISEFHGAWTGTSANLMSLISMLGGIASTVQSGQSTANYISSSQNNLNTLNQINAALKSTVGRINNITCAAMGVELLREFVYRSQSIHPAVNTYIQLNIGKYPYFQQISESTCSYGQIVLDKTNTPVLDRLNPNGNVTMQSSYRLRRNTDAKIYPALKPIIDGCANFLDVLFVRSMRVEDNIALLKPTYGKTGQPIPHGYNMTMDVFHQQRNKDTIQPVIMNATAKFGPSLELCNWAFPVNYAINAQAQFYTLQTELGPYIADGFNRPIVREPIIPIASDNDKTSIV